MSHLTLNQRYDIEIGLAKKVSISGIGEIIGKDKSVVSRELKRNADLRSNTYKAELAHKKATERHRLKPKKKHWDQSMIDYVNAQLNEEYSPDQISGRAKEQGVNCVSPESIYKHVWVDKKKGGSLYKQLRNKGKRYRKRGHSKDSRGILVGRVDIDHRPPIVDKKVRLGDLEIDLVIGKNHKQALLTINDRVSGILIMGKVLSKQAVEIEVKTKELLDDWKPLIHTITSDNGKEFANHKNIAESLNIDFYFAKPYHSWQRGANENLNGLIRQYFPKGYNFERITNERIIEVQNKLNNRPRKRFGYKTPNEVFAKILDNQVPVAFIS